MADATHLIEEVVGRIKAGSFQATPEFFDSLFGAVDLMRKAIAQADEIPLESNPQLLELVENLNSFRDPTSSDGQPESITTSDGFVLGEYDEVRIRILQSQGKSLHRLDVFFEPDSDSTLDTMRAVFSELRQLADVAATCPSISTPEDDEAIASFAVLIGSERSADELVVHGQEGRAFTAEVASYLGEASAA